MNTKKINNIVKGVLILLFGFVIGGYTQKEYGTYDVMVNNLPLFQLIFDVIIMIFIIIMITIIIYALIVKRRRKNE